MKKFLLGTVGLVALNLSGPASAADLAARPYTPPPPVPVAAIYNWTGFYVGINGGGGSARKCWDFVDPVSNVVLFDDGCHDATGGTVGGQIGYRGQMANWVFGFEGQGNWANFNGDHISLFDLDFRNRSRIDAFGLITGHVGYAWNNLLLYVKGGAAVTGDRYESFRVSSGALFADGHETRWGSTLGVGLEYGFAPNWSLGFEYNHLFMGDRDITFNPVGSQIEHIRQDVDIGLVRLNYRFGGWGKGPVVARY
jgi:outer membrane immunogenic protein